jgi:DNA (cytosine-5)-methyltransferase 1
MKVLDLFSGIGGFSLGLERAGFETVAFCEIDPFCQKVLKKHWPDVPIYEDVRNVSKAQLESDGIHGIEVITGGFPCQDLSAAGKQAGIDGERSGLWSECVRLLGDIRPKVSIFENVTALLSGDSGRWFAKCLRDLAEIGFDARWNCISAANIGAPHRRERVWIIAYPTGSGMSEYVGNRNIFSTWKEGEGKWRENWESGELVYGQVAPREWRIKGQSTATRPLLLRNDNGLSATLDRLRSLGNTVVPQIPEIIGRAIMEAEA